MHKIKTLLASVALGTGMASGAFAEECYPAGGVDFTNKDGQTTTVYALVDVPHTKGSPEARNVSVNANLALIAGDHDLKDRFGSQVQPSPASILSSTDGLCIDQETRDQALEEQTDITGTGIAFEGSSRAVHVFTPG